MHQREVLRQFIIENFLYGDERIPLKDDDSFSNKGIIDSTGVLELVAFLEAQFGVTVEDAEMVPDNFDSLDKLVAYLERKKGGAPDAH